MLRPSQRLKRLQRRLARCIVRPHLPARTIRLRLTAAYGSLFLVSGAGLLTITYLLVRSATGNGSCYFGADGFGGCVTGTSPTGPPATHEQGSGSGAGTGPSLKELAALAADQHAGMMHQLLIQSGIALAIMASVSIALGWVVAGRVLQPLRTITDGARSISATNLHHRLALAGPDDELKRLGDTIDALLDRLENAFDAQRRFVANASHELRTPLTVVRALLQLALTDPDATLESYRTTCREVIAEGEHQERLVEALLVLARSERGLDHREPLDLAEVTGNVLQSRRSELDRLGLRVRSTTAAAPTDGDIRLTERLVANLVDNALRYNVAGGHIDVATGLETGHAFVSVSNTGPAVPADQIDRLFQPFQRLDAQATHNGADPGLGLGLSIVQAIATTHGATLITQAHPAGGLHIAVSFPPSDGHPQNQPARS